MNADQLIPILKTLQSQAAPGVWDEALRSLSAPLATPAKAEKAEPSAPDAPAKAKKTLSAEHLAKLKAGREAAKAAKAAEAEASAKRHLKFDDEPAAEAAPAAAPAEEKPKRKLSEEQKAKMKAGREAAKAAKAAAEPAAPAEESGSEGEKAKRAPSAWALFSGRVAALVGEKGANLGLGAPPTVAAWLAEQSGVAASKDYASVSDARLVELARTTSKDALKSWAEAKKAKTAAEKPAKPAKTAAAAEADEVTADGHKILKFLGQTVICLADGRCYEPGAEEGELGKWAGLFKGGVLDATAAEP
jgi:hypothetical protein